MTIITRIAPSPTGYMHIGTARTALFNYLYAKRHGGKFLLRIEDTDRARSTEGAVDALIDGLKWLGLDYDGEPIFQFARMERHAEVAQKLVEEGKAYYCYTSKEELAEQREAAQKEGKGFHYRSPWRDKTAADAPTGIDGVVRIKAPLTGETTIEDSVQGNVTIQNDQLDDMILLRSDGTPTYMLSVVVDDHDMDVTYVIRGNEHFNNAFRQKVLYSACGWETPVFCHIPLINGSDGKKLSKRHGAMGVSEYEDMGYLPEALRNYLLRLGWSHGDDEIISDAQAVEWFSLENIQKSPAQFDFAKLDNLNGHYIRETDNQRLVNLSKAKIEELINKPLNNNDIDLLLNAMNSLKERAKTINDLAQSCVFYVHNLPLPMDEKAAKALTQDHVQGVLKAVLDKIAAMDELTQENAQTMFEQLMSEMDLKMGKIGPALRAATCGTMNAPDLKQVLSVLGKNRVIERIQSHITMV